MLSKLMLSLWNKALLKTLNKGFIVLAYNSRNGCEANSLVGEDT